MSLLTELYFPDTFRGIFGLARKTDPETSKAAAMSITTRDLEKRVYGAIAAFPGGCIADDVVEKLGLRWDTVTPRFAPLIKKGFIRRTGERRLGASGRFQQVLTITEKSYAK